MKQMFVVVMVILGTAPVFAQSSAPQTGWSVGISTGFVARSDTTQYLMGALRLSYQPYSFVGMAVVGTTSMLGNGIGLDLNLTPLNDSQFMIVIPVGFEADFNKAPSKPPIEYQFVKNDKLVHIGFGMQRALGPLVGLTAGFQYYHSLVVGTTMFIPITIGLAFRL
jgi:hypothetical protein